jgi:hypothetical protein
VLLSSFREKKTIWSAPARWRIAPLLYSLPAKAEIFAFADGNSVVAENVAGPHYVEIEARQGEIQKIFLSARLSRSTTGIV